MLHINNIEKYYAIEKERAEEVLSFYKDKSMTERKAELWIKKRCIPTDEVEKLIVFIKSLPY
jgi:hypothetical protein